MEKEYEPLLTKLVREFEGKDNTTLVNIAKALQCLQGNSLGDIGIDKSNNLRDEHLCNAVKIIASILRSISVEQFSFDHPINEGTQLSVVTDRNVACFSKK